MNKRNSFTLTALLLAPLAALHAGDSIPVTRPAETDDKGKAEELLNPRITKAVSLEVRELTAQGDAPEWKRPPGRIDVPAVEDSAPAPGKRVRYRLPVDKATAIYSVLNLPDDWQPGKKYPVIVEYPGNIFYAPSCYSTGLPEQCVIGYGMTKGKSAICLGMPFVDRATGKVVENGWGNANDTADYVMRMVAAVCDKFGGDPENLVLTGFSRGASFRDQTAGAGRLLHRLSPPAAGREGRQPPRDLRGPDGVRRSGFNQAGEDYV